MVAQADAGAEVLQADDRRRVAAGVPASAVPRLRATGRWTDSAVRRYVTDAGPLLPRLHKLVRADCTTRNKRRAARLQANYDDLEAPHRRAGRQGGPRSGCDRTWTATRSWRSSASRRVPQVGEAWRYLKELRLDRGPLEPRRGRRRADEVVERTRATAPSEPVMDYCLGDADGSATMWTADPDTDVDGDGALDAVGLDFDGDGVLDDAMADMDGDGLADHAVLDLDNDGRPEALLHRRRHRHLGGQRRPGRAIAVVRPGRALSTPGAAGRPRRRRAERRPAD